MPKLFLKNFFLSILLLLSAITAHAVSIKNAISTRPRYIEIDSPKPVISFFHGLWADGYCWSKVILTLQAHGFHPIALRNPATSLSVPKITDNEHLI